MIRCFSTRTLAGLTLVSGLFAGQASAQKTEDVLGRKPIQPGVAVSTPDAATCKAEPVSWPKSANGAAPTGVVVKDANGKLVRQFIDTTGRNNPNIFSYYLNGVEAYREIDAKGDGKPTQFRWLGPNGGKWGEDRTGDGVVDVWYAISPEELSQELFAVLQTRDPKRLDALLPKEEELKAIGLPPAEIQKILQRSAQVGKRIQAAADELKLNAQSKWIHLEVGVPQTTPGDAIGATNDLVVHRNANILFDAGDGKTVTALQTGELIQIGRSWRLVDGPAVGAAPLAPSAFEDGGSAAVASVPKELQADAERLNSIKPPAEPAELPKYHTDRAAILENMVAKTQGAAQEPWLKQMIDAYAAAAEASPADSPAMKRLVQWKDQIEKAAPKSTAAGYAAFRVLTSEYAVKLAAGAGGKQDDVLKIQEWWRKGLEEFVKANPQAEDAPEALLRLAVACEFAGRDGEADAKKWYETLAKSYPQHAYAAKAEGAVRRLTSEGQPLQLSGRTIGNGAPFTHAAVANKVVVVYYWATWGREAANELKFLAELHKTYGPKGLEIVTICLDDEAAKGVQVLNAGQIPGTHLHAPGGLEKSPLSVQYGIQMVPHAFLVAKDGKVSNRNAQPGPLMKDEIEKLLK